MTTFQYAKEATMNNLCLPIEIINIVKSFTFYDINTATKMKKVKKYKQKCMKTILDATFSNYKTTLQKELLEYNEENMAFYDGYWRFGYLNHSTETHYIQTENCTKCGNYVSEIYPQCIKCKCTVVENLISQYEFFQ
jgi:hypothetical protein